MTVAVILYSLKIVLKYEGFPEETGLSLIANHGMPSAQGSLHNMNSSHYIQRAYNAYKAKIDARITSIKYHGKPCTERTILAYTGELRVWLRNPGRGALAV